jgi:hypothetical protein
MHPLFVTLFIEPEADDALAEERGRLRSARQAKRGKAVRVVKTATLAPGRRTTRL